MLVEKLVKKGILSKEDAKEIITEVKEESWKERDKERAEIIKGAREAVKKDTSGMFAELPQWVRKMQLKADLRLRHEYTDRDDNAERHRAGTGCGWGW
ncbi:MAG: putative porin [Desulfomicrobium escambiense]|nr:putative porin [Desulfomicrobium escambiense]